MIPKLSSSDFFGGALILLFLAEIVVGIVQLIGALIRTMIRLNKGEALGALKTYWILVGIYFFVAALLYVAYLYFVESFFSSTTSYEYPDYERRARWTDILMASSIFWIVVAWGIAIWYWVKIFFGRKHKVEQPNV